MSEANEEEARRSGSGVSLPTGMPPRVLWNPMGTAVEVLWKCCGSAVELLEVLESCGCPGSAGSAVELLWVKCWGTAVEVLWNCCGTAGSAGILWMPWKCCGSAGILWMPWKCCGSAVEVLGSAGSAVEVLEVLWKCWEVLEVLWKCCGSAGSALEPKGQIAGRVSEANEEEARRSGSGVSLPTVFNIFFKIKKIKKFIYFCGEKGFVFYYFFCCGTR